MDRFVTIKVLFLSQQRLLRETFSDAFSNSSDIRFLLGVGDVNEAITSIQHSQADVILVDVNPSLFGITVTKQLRAACPNCRILILASHSDQIAEAQLLAAGVEGVLSKNIGMMDLACAIRKAYLGEPVSAKGERARALENSRAASVSGMTERETQVLELVAQGLANKQIADVLGISIKTVEKHRHRVMCKLQAHETAGLTWRAVCMGVGRATPASAVIPL